MFFLLLLYTVLVLKQGICSVPVINGIVLREDDYNKTWIRFPSGNGNLEVALLVENVDNHRVGPARDIEKQMKFELYTRNNTKVPEIFEATSITLGQEKSLKYFKLFDKNIPIKIIIHGWKGKTEDPIVQKIKKQYLQRGFYNIIAVDWSQISVNINYFQVVKSVPKVGEVVASLVNYMEKNLKANTKNIHIIGHSLGAHVSGFAGKHSNLKLARITGLDPARPLFEGSRDAKERLDKADADLVDVIHTCSYIFGFGTALGHVDFYPNGGSAPQPGCTGFQIISCSHGRAIDYFAESINSEKGFWSYRCDNYKNFVDNLCLKDYILMGDDVPVDSRGQYYLKTNSISVYALGKA